MHKVMQTLKNRTKLHYILYIVLVLGLFLTFSHSALAANPGSVDFNVNIAPTLTIDVTSGGVATSDVVLNLNPNTKTFDHQSVDINVATNNVTGYQLFVSTVDGKTELTRDNTDGAFSSTIPTIPTLTPTSPTTTGYSESDFRNCTIADCTNKWGYKVTASDTDPSTVTANYFPFVLNTNLATNHYASNGDNTTLDFAAKIDWAQPAGTYENTLVFTATATYAAYHIDYYDGINNTPGSDEIGYQTNAYNTASTIQINPTFNSGSAPTRNTYTLKSWCMDSGSNIPVNTSTEAVFNSTNTKITAYNNPATICNGTEYALDGTITIDPTEYNTNLKLYAIWEPTTVAQAYNGTAMTMQNMSKDICVAITPNQWAEVTDERDNQSYHIAKLEDNRCWMLDNLNIDLYNTLLANLQSKTNATNAELNYLKGISTGTTSDKYAIGGINSINSTNGNWTSGMSYSVPLTNRSGRCNSSVNASFPCLSPYQDNYYSYSTVIDKYGTSSTSVASITYNIGPGNYQIGTYYNYCAVSAGTYCYGNGATGGTSASGDATADVCPSAWRLPRSGTITYPNTNYNEFQYFQDIMNTNYPSTYIDATSPYSFQSMLSMPFSGDYGTTSSNWQGFYGIFWSSTYGDSARMQRIISSGSGTVALSGMTNRHDGKTVRCIAQN